MAVSETWSHGEYDDLFQSAPRGTTHVSASMFLKVAPTGALPVLAVADDGRKFWLKWPGNPHGNVTLVNELVVARVGQLIEAPVRPISLVHVDMELTEGYYAGDYRLPAGTYFGSELLQTVEEVTEILKVKRDGNAERFPRFLALWNLCLGADLQLLHNVNDEDQVWSIDHGLWFYGCEVDWTPELLRQWVHDAWEWPDSERPSGLSAEALHGAAHAVEGLSVASLAAVMSEVPVEWGVPEGHLRALAKFLHDRRGLIAGQLRVAAAHYS